MARSAGRKWQAMSGYLVAVFLILVILTYGVGMVWAVAVRE